MPAPAAPVQQFVVLPTRGLRATAATSSPALAPFLIDFSTDRKNFIGGFSNVGPEVDLTAPGVGVLSTVPDGYAPLSGTSMACPAVAGFAARLLAQLPQVLGMARTQERSDAIAREVLQAARTLGFAAEPEGRGMPR